MLLAKACNGAVATQPLNGLVICITFLNIIPNFGIKFQKVFLFKGWNMLWKNDDSKTKVVEKLKQCTVYIRHKLEFSNGLQENNCPHQFTNSSTEQVNSEQDFMNVLKAQTRFQLIDMQTEKVKLISLFPLIITNSIILHKICLNPTVRHLISKQHLSKKEHSLDFAVIDTDTEYDM
uniref:Uncharacterized protein n=1 Tax=Glossina brevipalpis TaxID=37001 RepID=A0A1A9WF83_9MUSC